MCSHAFPWWRPLSRPSWRHAPKSTRMLGLLAGVTLFAACDDEADTFVAPRTAGDPRPFIQICAPNQSQPGSIRVDDSASALGLMGERGEHLVDLRVDKRLTRNTGYAFRRITDALAEARRIRQEYSGSCQITISVASGTYEGSTTPADTILEVLPLMFDMEGVSLVGATGFARDSDGRPAVAVPGIASDTNPTMLVATPALRVVGGTSQTGVSEPLIVVNREEGTSQRGGRIVISGFILHSGHAAGDQELGGKGVLSMRAPAVVVQHNRFEGNFTERVDYRGGSGMVSGNAFTGPGDTCDICIAGPGAFTVSSNRLVQGGIPGVLIVPVVDLPVPEGVAPTALAETSSVEVEVIGNDISGHQRVPVGVGVRVATVGINAPNVAGMAKVLARGNVLHGNRFGMIVEAGFPVAGSRLRGDADIALLDNQFSDNCQADFYVAFGRHTAGLGLSNQPFLKDSRIRLSLGGLPWNTVWYAHPEGQGNVLLVNGDEVANGIVHQYNPTKVCE